MTMPCEWPDRALRRAGLRTAVILAIAPALMLAARLASAAAAGLPPCPPGWDARKWADLSHRTPKYVVGRIIAAFPHTPEGLRMALPVIQAAYPGAKILPGKGDKIHIPCVGDIDVVQAAGEGGKAWQWLVVKDECGACAVNVCNAGKSSSGGSPGQSPAPGPGPVRTPAPVPDGWSCMPPNAKPVVDRVLSREGMPEALRRACRNNTDWAFPNAVVDELRRTDRRWGYFCRRGNCNDPSHDVLAYYCGQGLPYEGADDVRGIDYIVASCYNDPSDGTPSIGWTVLDPVPPGTYGWTSRGRFSSGPSQGLHAPVETPQLSMPQPGPGPAAPRAQPQRPSRRPVQGPAPRRDETPQAAPEAAEDGAAPPAPPDGEAPPPAEAEPPADEPQ